MVKDYRRAESQSSSQQMLRDNDNEASLSSFLINIGTQETIHVKSL